MRVPPTYGCGGSSEASLPFGPRYRASTRFRVFGSFVTDKPDPNDIDVFLVMRDTFDGAQLRGEAGLLFDHAAADAHFGASVFWVRRLAALGGEQTTIEYWPVKRGGGQRGIVEIVEDTP